MKLIQPLTAYLPNRYGYEKTISLIANAGFDALDFSLSDTDILDKDDYIAFAQKIKKHADACGVPFLQAHSVFREITCKEDFDSIVKKHLRALEFCEVLECPILVIHPANDFSPEDNHEYLYKPLLPFAQKRGVRIATENMWNWDIVKNCPYPTACGTVESFCKQIDLANNYYLTGCVDIGHAEMTNAPGADVLIRGLGKNRVGCLHVHDNDLFHDTHAIPYQGNINWEKIISALRDINYCGNFALEVVSFIHTTPEDLLPDIFKYLERVGRYLIKRITE